MTSLKQKILDHLQSNYPAWHNGGEIEDFIRQTEFKKASNASRRCRELKEEGLIDRKLEKGTVWYQFKQQSVFEPVNLRPEVIKQRELKRQMSFL